MVSLASCGVDEAQIGPARSDRSRAHVVRELHRRENHGPKFFGEGAGQTTGCETARPDRGWQLQIQIAGRWR